MPRMYLGLIFLAYLCLTSFGSGLEKIFDASDRSLALLGPKSSCIKEAVQELLPECETGDLDVDQRVAYAIRLSICEFDASDVKYPSICHKEITIRCAQVLETRAQWWTTYSGYYQSIGQICFQYQKEHETERVLQLYRNINSVESQLYSHLVDALARLDLELAHSNETKYYFEEIGRQFEAINAISSEVMATYNNFMDRSLEKFNQLERLSDKVVQKSESVVERVSLHYLKPPLTAAINKTTSISEILTKSFLSRWKRFQAA
ncbi:hypothetical protein TRICI_002226 [Trichomonascus ciferrii]|uniref:Nuclear fusion protein KAR5 n=1 Tax=Trichomonascus ciferrii TaxID=44093 RepID=A0A642V7I2_9ASCO|nr:hypothetical protein TRICI_002226 [Trichomonascus ciferrii]